MISVVRSLDADVGRLGHGPGPMRGSGLTK